MKKTSLFQVIDFDRVLFDTEKLIRALTGKLYLTQPELAEKLQLAFDDAYAKEETFFLLRVLREMMSEQFPLFVETVVQASGGGEAFLLPGAKERLLFADSFSSLRPSIGILTYGDEIDQRLKLEIAGLVHVPTIISPTPNKSDVLRSWQQADGTFRLPSEFGAHSVDIITLEDDKLRAFDDMPTGVMGIWVNSTSTAKIPPYLVKVSNLAESIDYLKRQ